MPDGWHLLNRARSASEVMENMEMSKRNDIFELLVKETVRDVLFHDTSTIEEEVDAKKRTMVEILPDTLLYHLTGSTANPAGDERDNNEDEVCCAEWMKNCMNWSIEQLRTEKAAIKQYLKAHQRKFSEGCKKSSKINVDVLMIYEVHALLKLFILERDPHYRQCVQQSIGSIAFLTSLHVQLTLYATYFERAHGRKISAKVDVEPIQTLYEFFLAHQRGSNDEN